MRRYQKKYWELSETLRRMVTAMRPEDAHTSSVRPNCSPTKPIPPKLRSTTLKEDVLTSAPTSSAMVFSPRLLWAKQINFNVGLYSGGLRNVEVQWQ